MSKNLDTAKARLTVTSSSLSPEEISDKLGLRCDEARRVGDPKGRSQRFWEVNVWHLCETSEGDQAVNLALDGCLNRLRKRVANSVSAIQALSQTESVELGLYMLAQSVPPIHLGPDILAFIHELGVELDIDIVLYGE